MISHDSKDIDRRIDGIIASHEMEGLHSTDKDIEMLKKLAHHEITREEYDKFYGIGE